ncbi:MAG: (2Fe-2S)-binding protein [Myxococcota bacterium]|nr:(2Fe-2S)-binding protein [Myxococcota bacterium]
MNKPLSSTPSLLEFEVNGEPVQLLASPQDSLLDCLRDQLGLTGSKHGCDVGDCGACTVLLDGTPQLSCITLALEAKGTHLTTVEGLSQESTPHPVQAAFDEKVAAQCGYCTPGFVVALASLFETNPSATPEDVRRCLGSNICRCTGYTKIIEAAELARRRLQGLDT